jgi:hypothetical protein
MNIEIGIRVIELKVLKTVNGDIDLHLIVNEMQTMQKRFQQGYATVTIAKSSLRDWLVSSGVIIVLTKGSDAFRKGNSFEEVLNLLLDALYTENKHGVH